MVRWNAPVGFETNMRGGIFPGSEHTAGEMVDPVVEILRGPVARPLPDAIGRPTGKNISIVLCILA